MSGSTAFKDVILHVYWYCFRLLCFAALLASPYNDTICFPVGLPLPSQLGLHGLSSVPVSSPVLFPPGLPSPMSSSSVSAFPSFSFSPLSGPPARTLGAPQGLPRAPPGPLGVVCRPSLVGPGGQSSPCSFPFPPPLYPPPRFPPLSPRRVGPPSSPPRCQSGSLHSLDLTRSFGRHIKHLHALRTGGRGGSSEVVDYRVVRIVDNKGDENKNGIANNKNEYGNEIAFELSAKISKDVVCKFLLDIDSVSLGYAALERSAVSKVADEAPQIDFPISVDGHAQWHCLRSGEIVDGSDGYDSEKDDNKHGMASNNNNNSNCSNSSDSKSVHLASASFGAPTAPRASLLDPSGCSSGGGTMHMPNRIHDVCCRVVAQCLVDACCVYESCMSLSVSSRPSSRLSVWSLSLSLSPFPLPFPHPFLFCSLDFLSPPSFPAVELWGRPCSSSLSPSPVPPLPPDPANDPASNTPCGLDPADHDVGGHVSYGGRVCSSNINACSGGERFSHLEWHWTLCE